MKKEKINTSFKYIKNIADDKTEATILIYEPIGTFQDSDGQLIEGIDGKRFAQEMLYLETQVDTIHVRVNSIGGSVYDGWSIISSIMNSKSEVITYNDGLAASIAGLILVAGDTVCAMDYSLTMIHNPHGNENNDVLNKVKDSLLTILTKRSILPQEELNNLMNIETYFSADEAKQAGLIDEIISSEKKVTIETHDKNELVGIFNKLIEGSEMKKKKETIADLTNKVGMESPTTLTNEEAKPLVTNAETESPDEEETDPNETEEEKMGEDVAAAPCVMDKIKSHFGMKEDASDEDVYDSLKTHKQEHEDLKAENLDLKDKLHTIAEEAKKAHKTKIDAMVNSFVTTGKIKASEVDSTVKLALVDFEATKNMLEKIGIGTVSPAVRISSIINSGSPEKEETEMKLEDYWHKNPTELEKIKNSKPDVYTALVEDYKIRNKKK